jgi:hypothetical protein
VACIIVAFYELLEDLASVLNVLAEELEDKLVELKGRMLWRRLVDLLRL